MGKRSFEPIRIALAALFMAGCAGADGPSCDVESVEVETFGQPGWRLSAPVLFSAPYDGGDSQIETMVALLPDPLWGFEEGFGPVAGDPVSTVDEELDFDRYLGERARAIADEMERVQLPAGNRFGIEQFAGGDAVYIVFLILPTAGADLGTTPDSPTEPAPMIPHDRYPFQFRGDLFRECEVFNPNLDDPWREPPASHEMFEGQSRIPLFVVNAHELRSPEIVEPPAPGEYVVEQRVLDRFGRGYRYTVRFEVE